MLVVVTAGIVRAGSKQNGIAACHLLHDELVTGQSATAYEIGRASCRERV